MKNTVLFQQVLSEYDKARMAADYLYHARRDEVYFLVPRIKEIDKTLTRLGIDIAKRVLSGGGEAALYEMEQTNQALLKEKEALLRQNAFPDGYLTDVYQCPVCKDTGFVANERCVCLKRRLIEKHYEASNLNNIIKRENFDTFDLAYYPDETDAKTGISPRANMRKIYNHCLDFAIHFDESFKNLLLYGKTALGKTFLCNCIAKELLDKGKSVVYLTSGTLFRQIEEMRFHREEGDEPEAYYDMVYHSDLLILDDLGAEFLTAFTATELFHIINTRFLEEKPTVISTNLSPGDFEKYYSDRITSRLIGHYLLLRFIGDDIRLKKVYGM